MKPMETVARSAAWVFLLAIGAAGAAAPVSDTFTGAVVPNTSRFTTPPPDCAATFMVDKNPAATAAGAKGWNVVCHLKKGAAIFRKKGDVREKAAAADIRPGLRVEVGITGGYMESVPEQARVVEVTILEAAAAGGGEKPAAGGKKETIEITDASLAEALGYLKAKFDLRYVAKEDVLAGAKKVTLSGEFTLDEALAEVSNQAGVSAKKGDDGVVSISAAGEAFPALNEAILKATGATLVVEGEVIGDAAVKETASKPPGFTRRTDSEASLRVRRVLKGADEAGRALAVHAVETLQIDKKRGLRLKPGQRGTFYLARRADGGEGFEVKYLAPPRKSHPPAGAAGALKGEVEAGGMATIRLERLARIEATAELYPFEMLTARQDGRRVSFLVAAPTGSPNPPPPKAAQTARTGPLEPGEYALEASVRISYRVVEIEGAEAGRPGAPAADKVAPPAAAKVAWGEAVDGLQAGISLKAATPLSFTLHVRNIGREERSFTVFWDFRYRNTASGEEYRNWRGSPSFPCPEAPASSPSPARGRATSKSTNARASTVSSGDSPSRGRSPRTASTSAPHPWDPPSPVASSPAIRRPPSPAPSSSCPGNGSPP